MKKKARACSGKDAENLMKLVRDTHELEALTDRGLADLMIDEVWAHLPIGSRMELIADCAIERLQRSPLGKLEAVQQWSDPEDGCDEDD